MYYQKYHFQQQHELWHEQPWRNRGQLQHESYSWYEKVDQDHGSAMITTAFFLPLLYFILQLAAAAPGLFMPLFMLLLSMILLKN